MTRIYVPDEFTAPINLCCIWFRIQIQQRFRRHRHGVLQVAMEILTKKTTRDEEKGVSGNVVRLQKLGCSPLEQPSLVDYCYWGPRLQETYCIFPFSCTCFMPRSSMFWVYLPRDICPTHYQACGKMSTRYRCYGTEFCSCTAFAGGDITKGDGSGGDSIYNQDRCPELCEGKGTRMEGL